MNDAACRGLSDIFFPPAAERPQARERREQMARAVCETCEVLSTCRDFARNHHEYGFWGGESEEQRHHLSSSALRVPFFNGLSRPGVLLCS